MLENTQDAIVELRKAISESGVNGTAFKEAEAKTLKAFEENEEKNKVIVNRLAEADKKSLEFQERVKELEGEVAKGQSSVKGVYKETAEYKALQSLVKFGKSGSKVEEQKALRTDIVTAGGALVVTEFDQMLLKNITEISDVRSVSRVKSTSKITLDVAKRTGLLVANFEGEAEAASTSQSTYGSEQITASRLTVVVELTQDELMDSEFDLDTLIAQDVAEANAFAEGNAHILGDGVKKPEGVIVNSDIVAGAIDTIGSGAISGDDLLLLTGQLAVGQNPLFGFNRQTLATLRTLKGSDGHYLWQAGLGPNQPNTIGGERYKVFQDMPSIAVGALPVIYGDFLRGYTITDRTGLTIVRDELTKADQAIIRLIFRRYTTGQVVLSDAFQALKIKA